MRLLLALTLGLTACAKGEDLTVANIDKAAGAWRAGGAPSYRLNLEITGMRSVDQDPVVPDLAAFAQYLGSGTSLSMQIVGSQTTVSLTIQYRFQALEDVTSGRIRIDDHHLRVIDLYPVQQIIGARSEADHIAADFCQCLLDGGTASGAVVDEQDAQIFQRGHGVQHLSRIPTQKNAAPGIPWGGVGLSGN